MTPEEKQRFLILSCHMDLMLQVMLHLKETVPDFDKYYEAFDADVDDRAKAICMSKCADILYRKIPCGEWVTKLIESSYEDAKATADARYNDLAIASMLHDMIDAKDTDD